MNPSSCPFCESPRHKGCRRNGRGGADVCLVDPKAECFWHTVGYVCLDEIVDESLRFLCLVRKAANEEEEHGKE